MYEALWEYVHRHTNDEVTRLRLKAERSESFDVSWAIDQIEIRPKVKHKLPDISRLDNYLFASKAAYEQASSEWTARYKQRLMQGQTLCDLTGGQGIDTYYLSQVMQTVTYIEQIPHYCNVARHNFTCLGAQNIHVVQGDSTTLLTTTTQRYDTLYIDPARRDHSRRLYALADCQPNIVACYRQLLQHAQRLVVKVSPMVDLTRLLSDIPETKEIHILAVKNECKEVLLVIDGDVQRDSHLITTVNHLGQGEEEIYQFTWEEEEKLSTTEYASSIYNYLYEPHAAAMKGGAFKSLVRDFGVRKLAPSSHLYTSEAWVENFPGRKFKVVWQMEYSNKEAKKLGTRITQANITVRNFPLTVEELRKRIGMKEGGDLYLFASTLSSGKKILIGCHKAS